MNSHAEKGMSTSIRRGLQVIRPDSQGILIALGDQPFLKTRTINALIRAFGQEGEGIVIPSFRGRKGHPVIFHRRYKKELSNLKGDMGGKSILEKHPEDVKVVHSKSAGVVKDVDTWQDYATPTAPLPKRGGRRPIPPLCLRPAIGGATRRKGQERMKKGI
jgi:molybdenum cofactor cytidylyltransferase